MDEKQLQDQNTAFKIGYLAAFTAIIFFMYLTEIKRIPLTAYSALMICFFISFATCDIVASLKNVYFGTKNQGVIMHVVLGFVGIADTGLIISRLVNVHNWGMEYLSGGVLNDIVPWAVTAVCMFLMCGIYFVKMYLNKKAFSGEED